MVCKKCGGYIDKNAEVCESCGATVKSNNANEIDNIVMTPEEKREAFAKRQATKEQVAFSKLSKTQSRLIIIVLVLILGAVLFSKYYTYSKKKTQEEYYDQIKKIYGTWENQGDKYEFSQPGDSWTGGFDAASGWQGILISNFSDFVYNNDIDLESGSKYRICVPYNKDDNDYLIEKYKTNGIYIVIVKKDAALYSLGNNFASKNKYDDYMVITKIDDNSMVLKHKNSIIHLTK